MANYIVIRLVPTAPVAASDFTASLEQLTVKVYDVSYAQPDAGTPGDAAAPLGQAGYLDPTIVGLPAAYPGGPYVTYPAGTGIAQNFSLALGFGQVVAIDWDSVATAVIEVPAGLAEYVGPDLRIVLERTGGAPIYGDEVYYDVALYASAIAPTPDLFPTLPPSCYLTLPPSPDPGVAHLAMPKDGTAPNFDALLAAIDQVVAADPGSASLAALVAAKGPLSAAQARIVAHEIVWGPRPPLPEPTEKLEDLYTNPPNSGSSGDSNEQNRQQFEGSLNGYYATRDAQSEQLAKYVFAVSAALWCTAQTAVAMRAWLRFPTHPGAASVLATTSLADVVVEGVLPGDLGLTVPAACFYALTAQLPTQITPAQRLRIVSGATVRQNLTQLAAAVDAKVIATPAAPDPSQVVRMLAALAVPTASAACPLATLQPLWNDWLAWKPADWRLYQADDELQGFWSAEIVGPPAPSAAVKTAFLNLVLWALTQGWRVPQQTPNVSLAALVVAGLTVTAPNGTPITAGLHDVDELAQALAGDWQAFFDGSPLPPGASRSDLLPGFTRPGGVPAFIQHVRKFFDVPTADYKPAGAGADTPALLAPPSEDWLADCLAAFGPLTFGTPFTGAQLAGLKAAVATVFAGDPSAQAWALQAIVTLNELALCAAVGTAGPALQFAIAEALYARGFTGIDTILDRPLDDFEQALTGTVAWEFAALIHAKAGPPAAVSAPAGGGFAPVNDGSLRQCLPPEEWSPLGPVAYLHEMLQVSELSTCRDVAAVPAPGHGSLGATLASRRGPLGDLHATRANLETPVPRIDLLNECLEAMAATLPAGTAGVVHDTPDTTVDDHLLCPGADGADPCCGAECTPPSREHACHEPARLLGARPAFSTPCSPGPDAWERLKRAFGGCELPYAQAIDVSRTYLRRLGSCRFETMRTFRRCITEFVLAPQTPPPGFAAQSWRYPVRIDSAIEFLGITPEVYTMLFAGAWPEACGAPSPNGGPGQPAPPSTRVLYGFPDAARGQDDAGWIDIVLQVPEFLARTCLDYCEFVELAASGLVPFAPRPSRRDAMAATAFPACEPCCLADLRILFPEGVDAEDALRRLMVVVRLHRLLREACQPHAFDELADVCEVLSLFEGASLNPDFVRQLAALQMLRERYQLPLRRPGAVAAPGVSGAARSALLALWAGPDAAERPWAVRTLLDAIARRVACLAQERRRDPRVVKVLVDNLDALSLLAGFDPALATDTWSALPTHTLRFAEVLEKIEASDFTVGEVLYLFTADVQLQGDEPFPLQYPDDAEDDPLALPDDLPAHSMWRLRHELLEDAPADATAEDWPWARVESFLVGDLGFAPAAVATLAAHFFAAAAQVPGSTYAEPLAAADTAPAMWASYTGAPMHYVAHGAGGALTMRLPLRDADVLRQLRHVRPLQAAERAAVQGLYWQPRAELAGFAMLFPDLPEALHRLVEEPDEALRWAYFRDCVTRCRARCEIIAQHLARHVAAVTGDADDDGDGDGGDSRAAARVLRHLLADENRAVTGWESDAGGAGPFAWAAPGTGTALGALLALTGTGLDREYSTQAGGVVWRDVTGGHAGFGHDRDARDCPLPTLIPSLDFAPSPAQDAFIGVLNGMAMADADDHWIGGAQDFRMRLTGALLVEHDGDYDFSAGPAGPHAPQHEDDGFGHPRWRIVMNRGQRTWLLLHHGHAEHRVHEARVFLRRGVYQLDIDVERPPLAFRNDADVRAQHTGFRLVWRRAGDEQPWTEIERRHLYRFSQDDTLAAGVAGVDALAPSAQAFLARLHTGTLRDIRRTYQRAFKALLFVRRLGLSARPGRDHASELGYLLSRPAEFAGSAAYRSGAGFARHDAFLDFNLWPLLDDFLAPTPARDARVAPSPQRRQALFDAWERLVDYGRARDDVHARSGRPLWRLFDEAAQKAPAHPAYLLRHMGVDARHWVLATRFHQDDFNPAYVLASTDMTAERWVLRAWHADHLARRFAQHFPWRDITRALPHTWVALDPAIASAGEPLPGNTNLRGVIEDGLLERIPRLYDDLACLDDGLRERGRDALLAWLCGPGGAASTRQALAQGLLMDVDVHPRERASRIEDAICSVQAFMRQARLGLEPGWSVGVELAALWDARFASFAAWRACRRKELYQENWVEWHELERARRVESFEFLESELQRASLAIAVPGGQDYWPDRRPPSHPGLPALQRRAPSRIRLLDPPRQGLGLLGTPDADARPSWLATVTGPAPARGGPGRGNDPAAGGVVAGPANPSLPLWMEAAVRLGTGFLRIAAATLPPAANAFEPRPPSSGSGADETCVDCCAECGCVRPCRMDEFYFWLVDSARFVGDEQDPHYDATLQAAIPWHDATQLPALLEWAPTRTVRLAWCRVHNGEFQPPRRSVQALDVAPGGAVPALQFMGRVGDSLYLAVNGAVPPPSTPALPAGFRYDLAPDMAQAVGVLLPKAPPVPYPGGLFAYPYFIHHCPGARLFPWSLFTPAIAVADALRTHCRFEAALKWYALAFDPLARDDTWIHCDDHAERETSACCDSSQVSCATARDRAVLLRYVETLVDWSRSTHRPGTIEADDQTRLLLDTCRRILGPAPRVVRLEAGGPPPTVADFVALAPPLNPRLLALYEHVDDGLALLHARMSARRLRHGRRDGAGAWIDAPWHEGDVCCGADDACMTASPYRFQFLSQKAQELAAHVHEFGNGVLAAIEKGDAEYLAAMRQRQEHELVVLGRRMREDAWRDADWQVQALRKSKESDQASRRYYAKLIADGLIANEQQYVSQIGTALDERIAGNVIEGVAEVMDVIPDIFVGFPCEETQLPVGTKLAGLFKTLARITNTLADVAGTTASLDLTEAGWDRRVQEWAHQVEVLDIQIEQVELQTLGAERRRDQALRELDNQERQIENAREVLDFLRDKFSSHATYLWLQKEGAQLHARMLDLATGAARQAERAFNLERGHQARRFVPPPCRTGLKQGLLAGEQLQLALAAMEKTYFDHNVREHELSTDFSLRTHFPMEFLRLKLTGRCEIDIAEWMFDLQYPGHFLRRIRSVGLTIPCVTGPYVGVHCRLTLLRSDTRIDPALAGEASGCCDRCRPGDPYVACPHDRRIARQYGANEAIATSHAQNDTGMFDFNFHDERYLPFEFAGAASRWRLELAQDDNWFDMDTLSDVVLQMNYTAREGGAALAQAARDAARCHLPDQGWRLLDVRYDLPDAWARLHRTAEGADGPPHQLAWRVERNDFPFIPGACEIEVDALGVVFERTSPEPDCCDVRDCGCATRHGIARHAVELLWGGAREHQAPWACDAVLDCVESEDWNGLYHGVVHAGPASLAPLRVGHEARLRWHADGVPERLYLLLHYTVCRRPTQPRCAHEPRARGRASCECADAAAGPARLAAGRR